MVEGATDNVARGDRELLPRFGGAATDSGLSRILRRHVDGQATADCFESCNYRWRSCNQRLVKLHRASEVATVGHRCSNQHGDELEQTPRIAGTGSLFS